MERGIGDIQRSFHDIYEVDDSTCGRAPVVPRAAQPWLAMEHFIPHRPAPFTSICYANVALHPNELSHVKQILAMSRAIVARCRG
jgi:hypothetical protein